MSKSQPKPNPKPDHTRVDNKKENPRKSDTDMKQHPKSSGV